MDCNQPAIGLSGATRWLRYGLPPVVRGWLSNHRRRESNVNSLHKALNTVYQNFHHPSEFRLEAFCSYARLASVPFYPACACCWRWTAAHQVTANSPNSAIKFDSRRFAVASFESGESNAAWSGDSKGVVVNRAMHRFCTSKSFAQEWTGLQR